MKPSRLGVSVGWVAIIMTFALPTAAGAVSQQAAVCSGAGTTHGDNLHARATIGQPAIGLSGDSNYITESGFCRIMLFETVMAVEDEAADELCVFQFSENRPEPFSSSTTLRFAVPDESHVSIKLYNLAGQHVLTVTDRLYEPGQYAVRISGTDLANGVYFCRMTAGEYARTRKMMVLK